MKEDDLFSSSDTSSPLETSSSREETPVCADLPRGARALTRQSSSDRSLQSLNRREPAMAHSVESRDVVCGLLVDERVVRT